jgi:hypothetical protein
MHAALKVLRRALKSFVQHKNISSFLILNLSTISVTSSHTRMHPIHIVQLKRISIFSIYSIDAIDAIEKNAG